MCIRDSYAIFPTRTDNIFIGVGNDGTFRKLAKEIGKPELCLLYTSDAPTSDLV